MAPVGRGDEREAGGWHPRNNPLVVRARLAWAILLWPFAEGAW